MVIYSRKIYKHKRYNFSKKISSNIKKKKFKGGDKIGEGNTASVYRPAIDCIPEFITNSPNNYVSKVFEEDKYALKELNASELIKSRIDDPDEFIILPVHFCKTDLNNIIIYPYGGKTIEYYIHKNNSADVKKDIIYSIMNLFDFVVKMNKADICHGDIFKNNIVYNEETKKSLLIDLEKMKEFNILVNKERLFLTTRAKKYSENFINRNINEIYNRDTYGIIKTIESIIEKKYKKLYYTKYEKLCDWFVINRDIPSDEYNNKIQELFDTIKTDIV